MDIYLKLTEFLNQEHPKLRKSDKAIRNTKQTWSLTLAQLSLFYCSAWPRLKLSTKIGLHTTTTHHTNS